jgi:hypothetical protein
MVIAADSPFGPEPTMIASYLFLTGILTKCVLNA